jgi:hypothetical protein
MPRADEGPLETIFIRKNEQQTAKGIVTFDHQLSSTRYVKLTLKSTATLIQESNELTAHRRTKPLGASQCTGIELRHTLISLQVLSIQPNN